MSAATASKSNAWIWTVVKGILALGLGLFLLFSAATAPIWVAYALAIYIAVLGGLQTFSSFMKRNSAGSKTDRIRGLVGLIGGVALLLLGYFNVLSLGAAYTLLAILLIAFGALGLFEALFDRGADRFRWMPLLVNLLLIVLGVMVFYSRIREFDLRLWSGLVLAIIGLVIIAYGYFFQKANPKAIAAEV